MSPCVLCGRACIPMADYEQTVCAGCDSSAESVLIRAELMPPAPPARPESTVVPLDCARPLSSYYGPAPQQVIDELVDALFPNDKTTAEQQRRRRRSA